MVIWFMTYIGCVPCRRLAMVEFIAVLSYNINNIATTLANFVLPEGKSDS